MKIITFPQLQPAKGIPYTDDHIRRKVKDGTFPAPIRLSERRIAWIEEEIDEWLAELAAKRGVVAAQTR